MAVCNPNRPTHKMFALCLLPNINTSYMWNTWWNPWKVEMNIPEMFKTKCAFINSQRPWSAAVLIFKIQLVVCPCGSNIYKNQRDWAFLMLYRSSGRWCIFCEKWTCKTPAERKFCKFCSSINISRLGWAGGLKIYVCINYPCSKNI
jgi:hypothetical protein